MKIMGKSWENDETWRFNAGDIKELMEGSTGRSPFSRGFWENQGTVAGDTGFFSHRWFSNVKKGPHGPRVQESKPRIARYIQKCMTLWICMDLYLILSDLFLLYTFIKFVSLWLDRLRSPSWYFEIEELSTAVQWLRIQKSNFLLEAWISQHFTIIFPWNDFFPHHFQALLGLSGHSLTVGTLAWQAWCGSDFMVMLLRTLGFTMI